MLGVTNYHDHPVRNSGSLQNSLFLHSPLFCLVISLEIAIFSELYLPPCKSLTHSLHRHLFSSLCCHHFLSLSLSGAPFLQTPSRTGDGWNKKPASPKSTFSSWVEWGTDAQYGVRRARPGHRHNRGVRGSEAEDGEA